LSEPQLFHGDCLEILAELPDNSVDLVVNDPPYGTTSLKWDEVLDFEEVWKHLKRVMKPKTHAIFFGSQPFTSKLIVSNEKWFKYELIWNKNKCGSPGLAKYRPLKVHENIIVFANGGAATYNPIMETGNAYIRECKTEDGYGTGTNTHSYGFGKNKVMKMENSGTRYPKSILHASRNFSAQQTVHPTQKPTNVLNWLIMTYSNPGETVLDFTMGAGSTGVAAKMTGRTFIGIEQDLGYFQIAQQRIDLCEDTVERSDAQLTTQIHEDMTTTPSAAHEREFKEDLKSRKKDAAAAAKAETMLDIRGSS
jgi:site-specific DNA-methyltransferase (adenine-specific)